MQDIEHSTFSTLVFQIPISVILLLMEHVILSNRMRREFFFNNLDHIGCINLSIKQNFSLSSPIYFVTWQVGKAILDIYQIIRETNLFVLHIWYRFLVISA